MHADTFIIAYVFADHKNICRHLSSIHFEPKCIPGEAAISLGISNQHVYSCGLHIPVPVGYEFLFTIRGCSAHLRLQTFIADSTEDPRDNIPGSSVRLPLESLVLTFKEAQ